MQPKKEGGKLYTKAPKIQRLVTPQRLQRKRHRITLKRRRAEAAKDAAVSLAVTMFKGQLLTEQQSEYAKILQQRVAETKAHEAELKKRRASSMRK